jgi:glycine hydroxymethyltransferase
MAAAIKQDGFRLVSDGTDNHLMLVDLTTKHVTGRQVEEALAAVGIIINRNAIPFDTTSPTISSGIRLGTPAITSRGMGKTEVEKIASLAIKVINNINDSSINAGVKQEVSEICRRFPVPGIND